jgi:hypothetical protein
MAGKRLVDQKRLRAKKRRRLFFISLYSFFFVGLMVCGASLVSSLSVFQIRDISVVGADRISPITIESSARGALSGAYISLFPRANTFIYPESAIEESLLSLPLVQSVDISRHGFTALDIEIAEREEVAQWCGESTCYSVDEDGYVFSETASSSVFVYRGLLTGDPIGQTLMTKEKFRNTEFFMREIRNMSLSPVEGLFSANEYLIVTLSGGGKLYIYTEDDLSAVLATLESIISDKSITSSVEAFLSTLIHLKLDAGGKVGYKKK